jgi:phosphopantetheinyl transferase
MPTEQAMSRAALRELAHEVLRVATGTTAVSRLCPRCGSARHGRPVAHLESGSAPDVSLSYAPGLVAVAWGWAGRVGIDVEVVGPEVDGINRREWTRREAAFKAGGADAPLAAIEVPAGYVGSVAGNEVSWRLAGPAARSA